MEWDNASYMRGVNQQKCFLYQVKNITCKYFSPNLFCDLILWDLFSCHCFIIGFLARVQNLLLLAMYYPVNLINDAVAFASM